MTRSFRRLVLGTIGIALLAACDDNPVGRGPAPARPDEPGTGPAGDVLATPRLGVELSAAGAFRPGAPIVVTATARARHDAGDVQYDLMVPDDDGTVDARQRGLGGAVGTFRGAMGRGAQRQLTATITFARPGYYRVEAVARNTPAAGDPQQAADSVLIDLAANTLYVLIDERGGRLTNGYDRFALAGRTPAGGSFGPFVQGRGGAGTSAVARQVTMNAVGGRHRIVYQNLDAPKNPDGTTALTHVPGVRIIYECLNSSYSPVSRDSLLSAADGTFTIPCSSGFYNASAHLRNAYSNVLWSNRANAAVDTFFEYSETDLRVSNLRGGHVHRLLYRYVPLVNQRFGASRARLTYLVNNIPTTSTGTHYLAGSDEVELNHDAVFAEYGRFTIMHEYGHAYHYKAIEPWAVSGSYCAGSPTHNIDQAYDHNCAFVEGFADFFGSWITADSLVSGLYSDWKLETQKFYVGKDGAQVEGAFAGFLYDLVDGPSDPDAMSNTGSIDDTEFVDGVTYPASFIASTMRLCTLSASGSTYTRLFASYDLIYCLENRLDPYYAAQSLGYYNWFLYGSVTRNVAAPTGYSADAVRRLWRANLYGG